MKEFYILSLKWSRDNEQNLTWWMSNRSGYTSLLEHAGRYGEAEAKCHEGSDTTIAIPCEVVDRLSSRVLPREAARSMLTEVLGRPAGLAGSTLDDRDYEGRDECPDCGRAYGRPGPSRIHVDKHGGGADGVGEQ